MTSCLIRAACEPIRRVPGAIRIRRVSDITRPRSVEFLSPRARASSRCSPPGSEIYQLPTRGPTCGSTATSRRRVPPSSRRSKSARRAADIPPSRAHSRCRSAESASSIAATTSCSFVPRDAISAASMHTAPRAVRARPVLAPRRQSDVALGHHCGGIRGGIGRARFERIDEAQHIGAALVRFAISGKEIGGHRRRYHRQARLRRQPTIELGARQSLVAEELGRKRDLNRRDLRGRFCESRPPADPRWNR